MAECHLPKVDVAGSNPVPRSYVGKKAGMYSFPSELLRFLKKSFDPQPAHRIFLTAGIGVLLIAGCEPYHDTSYYHPSSGNPPGTLQPVSFKDTLQKRGAYHTVQRGETIYKIARDYDTDVRQLIKINKLDASGYVEPGRMLFIPRPGLSTGTVPVPASTPVSARNRGRLIFGEPMRGQKSVKNNEMAILAGADPTVYAAEDGYVSFCDTLRGYGSTVIIEHEQGLSTVYANLAKTYVTRRARVRKGERIGEVSLAANNNVLRFQIRRGKQVLDPLKYVR